LVLPEQATPVATEPLEQKNISRRKCLHAAAAQRLSTHEHSTTF
jgi:hypothetical protein